MSHRKTLLAASIIAGLWCVSGALYAQDNSQTSSQANQRNSAEQANKEKIKELSTITVTGIRSSAELSLDTKRADNTHVEVVSAEDIGKLPAKNVADTLQRLPGVNISSSSASEGAFDEVDRVSLRGTNPSMTQTTINGHTVATGDWFVLNQVQTVGRSVSFSLLPSEIVSQVVVHKTSEASLLEGGSAGSVDIITRKPLEYAKQFTAEASVGGVYADLPGNVKPQFSGLFNYKSADNTFGALVQAFYEERSLQRDGQEVVGGYNSIPLNGKTYYYPNEIGNALFTQTRKREGGAFDLEWKPTDNLTLNLDGFYSQMKADNFNRNYMLWTSNALGGGGQLTNVQTQGNVITAGNIAGGTGAYGVYDQISRPGAKSKTNYITLTADWKVNDKLSFRGEVGTTHGSGDSPHQDVIELGENVGGSGSWSMNGLGTPINWNEGPVNNNQSTMAPSFGWIFGEQGIHMVDKETWVKGDGELDFDGPLSSVQFGGRYATHTRDSLHDIAQGPNFASAWQNPAAYPGAYSNYPSDFGSQIGANVPGSVWYFTPAQLAQIDAQFANRNPVTRFYWNDIYKVKEKDTALYAQANFDGDRWGGNFGFRYVHTAETINDATTNPDPTASSAVGPITTSAFGPYYWNTIHHSYNKVLPSANLKFDLTDDVIARFAASQTLTRPDYSALAGSVSLDDLTHTGAGGNPGLKPLVSTNFDAALEWYFAPRGLLSGSVYEMSLSNYVNFADVQRVYKDIQASGNAGHDVFATYTVTVPSNTNGNVKGVELTYDQPIGKNWGVETNYTYANARASGGAPLQGTSKNTFNASVYFENDLFNARLAYTYRSSFYDTVSHGANYFQAGVGNLAFSAGYKINDWMSVTFDAMNLNNPKWRYYYQDNNTFGKQPYAFYVNGRQYYFNLRFKF
ncbi:TonB-dependent receptor [Dyella choica]|uniref:TonB-dependent receptor n=1 Tax=Dyella choica TaxID=1927959 RepID=A0A3S0R439_9GAMM|nr:TonB-dependent receptor [Dyella choica]RUL76100.1 TonB-dependent receptor [Dyella choica]